MATPFPAYISRSADYNSGLPYSFIGARYYNFILRGDMDRLQALCDRYINRPSGFKVAVGPLVPYVIVTFADYPKAYSEALDPAKYGFMQYQEAVFTIVLRRRQGLCGLGEESLSFIPYLFLDNPRAITAGREVFALPKVHGRVHIPQPNTTAAQFFNCVVKTLPSFDPMAQARPMELLRVEAPSGFEAEESPGTMQNPFGSIDAHVASSMGSDSDLNASELRSLTHGMQLPFLNLRQFRGFPDLRHACAQSVFKYQAANFTMTNGGALHGKFELSFPEESPVFPIVDSLGLVPRIVSAFWYEWSFQFVLGEDLWNADRPGLWGI